MPLSLEALQKMVDDGTIDTVAIGDLIKIGLKLQN